MEQKPTFYKKHRTFFNPSATYNGQDVLKNHFLRKHPVVYTHNPDPMTVKGLKSPTGYVWMINHGLQILESFPWYYRPAKKNTVYQFAHMYDNARKVKSWLDIQLVPVDITEDFEYCRETHIAAFYDMYQGKPTFDIFYLGEEVPTSLEKFGAKTAKDIEDAQTQSETTFLWVVPSDVEIEPDFDFTYEPDGWSFDYCHVFRNGSTTYDGVILLTVHQKISKNEELHRFYRNTKYVSEKVSSPERYEHFYIDTYEEYLRAAQNSKTRMFWGISNDADLDDFNFNYYVAKYDARGQKSTHVFLRKGEQLGVFLFSVDNLVTRNEFEYNHYINRVEIDLTPKAIDVK